MRSEDHIAHISASGERKHAARYIADMAVQLRAMASDCGLDLLAHILDMAVEEAEDRSKDP
jgi:hypothetical protein